MSLTYSLACEVTPWLSLGGGFFLSQKTYSRQEVFSAINYSNYVPGFTHPDEVIGSRLSIWSRAEAFVVPVAGVLLKPPGRLKDRVSLGGCWRAQNKIHHARGPLVASIGLEDANGEPLDLGILHFVDVIMSSIVGFQPAQATLALAFRGWPWPVQGLAVSADLTWKDFSKFVDYNDEKPDPAFQDTLVPRVGVEYAFDPRFASQWLAWIRLIAVRGGYYFEMSPVISSDKRHNIFDTDMDVISTGLQFDFTSRQGRLRHSFEAYFQAHLLRERRVENDEDSFFGPATLSGNVLSFGVSLTTQF